VNKVSMSGALRSR